MHPSGFRTYHVLHSVLLMTMAACPVRAEDDFVAEDKPAAPQVIPFAGENWAGKVIIMPEMQLKLDGRGNVRIQGGRIQGGNVPDAAAAVQGVKQPYLGVVARPVPSPVRAQLDLPEGVGVSVDAVAAGSPAEKAGMKPFDVLRKFDDQTLVSAEQLTTLVKLAGAGTKVPLTLLRGGRERVVEAVLEEHEVPAGEPNLEEMIWGADGLDPREQAELERTLAERWARWSRAGLGGVAPPGFAPGAMPRGGHAKAWVTAGPNTQSMTVVRDARGTVEIRGQGDKRTVTLTDAGGEEVYSGPLDTEEDFAKVPEEYRDWVREVDPRRPADREVAAEAKDSVPATE